MSEENDEPALDEEDITTEDHRVFCQNGGIILKLRADLSTSEMWSALEEHMAYMKFWPNVWFISDHGNNHLMKNPKLENES